MDIPGVNEDWEHQVTPLLQEMTNCEDEYFNPHEVSLKAFYFQQQKKN